MRPRGVVPAAALALVCALAPLAPVAAQKPSQPATSSESTSPRADRQKPDRSSPPPLGPAPTLTLPPVQRRTLANGLEVRIVEQHEVPLVQVNLLVRAGSASDPRGKYGLASLTADMLDEGAGTRDALELADAIEFLGAQLVTSSSWDYSAVRLSVPVSRLGEALPLLADVVQRPTFPERELERLRKERLTSLLQARDDPAALGQIAFPRIVFGEEHRYGTPAGGLAPDLKAIARSDLQNFHTSYYRPEHSTLIVVGDITPDGVMPLLETMFGAWIPEGTGVTPTPLPAAAQLTERRIYIVDKPGAAQSQIAIGWVGVPRTTPDYPVIQVLNTILGGSFTSRLNTNLRETHGYTYGASSGFEERVSPGAFVARAGVQTDKTAEALREFFNEFTGILEPAPRDEIEKARNYIVLGFPSEFETTSDLARKIEEQVVFGLADEYFTSYLRLVAQVTGEGVEEAADKYIQPDKFAVVIVGDRKAIEAPVRALGLGPVETISVDDLLGPM